MLKPADVLASNGRGVVREVRVAVFAVIPRHDDERTNDSYYAYVAFSFAQRSFFFVLFLSSSLRFFVTSPKDVHKVPKMMGKKNSSKRDHFLCAILIPQTRGCKFSFWVSLSPLAFGVCKNPPSQKAWERGERETPGEREREKERA